MRNLYSLVLDVEKNKYKWTPFNNNQKDLRNQLNELASKNINAHEDRVYKGSHFLGFSGFKKGKERIEQFKTQKLNKQHAMKNRDC